MSSIITEGNTTSDAELRSTSSGKQVAHVVLAVNDRTRDAEGTWVDGASSFYEITVWGQPAHSFAAAVTKGARLIVAGELTVESYTASDATIRTRRRITADYAGLSTRFGTPTHQHTEPRTESRRAAGCVGAGSGAVDVAGAVSRS
jgi:single-strand DNA-binding protein